MTLDFEGARSVAVSLSPALGAEHLSVSDAVGRRLADSLVTPIDLPHYASSAMDGWAVRGAPPWRLVPGPDLADGEAIPIVTGGLVPVGAGSVLRSEAGRLTDAGLQPIGDVADRDLEPGRHIREAGTEATAGALLLPAGIRLTPPRAALAAAAGFDDVPVRVRPRVAVVLTGDEVLESGLPGPGRVRDSFRIALPSVLEGLDARVVSIERIGDDRSATIAALSAADADVVLTTGGTGRSGADHVRAALEQLGAELRIPSVAMRPGGPTLVGALDNRVVLGLPGNPLAALLALLAIGGPLLLGAVDARTVSVPDGWAGRPGATQLVPVTTDGGVLVSTPHLGSAMLRGLAAADAVLVVPPAGITKSGSADALPLPWLL